MIGKGNAEGPCHLCGIRSKLTSEHVPAQSAYNKKAVKVITFEDVIKSTVDEAERIAYTHQGGFKLNSLCRACNMHCGDNYVSSFKDWCVQGMTILDKAKSSGEAIYVPYELYPLRVLKEIATMFLAINDYPMGTMHAELARFVLDPQKVYLSPAYRFFTYYNTGGRLRAEKLKGIGNIDTGKFSFVSEIAYPPFGYLLTFDTDPPDTRVVEISHFSRYDFNDKVRRWMRLPLLRTEVPIAGDYR